MPNISSVIKAIQDIMRKDTGVDGDAQRLSQIVWMLFLKIFADKEEEAEVMSDDYTSPLEEKYRWQNWAKDDEGMTGDELIDFINNELFPYLQNHPRPIPLMVFKSQFFYCMAYEKCTFSHLE